MEHPRLRDSKRLLTHEDIQKTGRAVLNIWNERVNIAQDYYNPLRTSILVRSNDLLSYTLFEEENHRYVASNYRWEENPNGNLIGIDIETGETCFTWQPHGSQFTLRYHRMQSVLKSSNRLYWMLKRRLNK